MGGTGLPLGPLGQAPVHVLDLWIQGCLPNRGEFHVFFQSATNQQLHVALELLKLRQDLRHECEHARVSGTGQAPVCEQHCHLRCIARLLTWPIMEAYITVP